jgi:hypothetical protein
MNLASLSETRIRKPRRVTLMLPLVLLTGLVASTPGEARAQAGEAGTAQTDSATQTAAGNAAPASDEPRTVDEFLLISKNGDRIAGRDGSLTANRFTGISSDGKKLDFLPDDIGTLYRKEGSEAGKMALYGAGIGLVFSGVVLWRASDGNPDFFRHELVQRVSLGLVGGSTALGALIGLAVGAGQSRWSVEPLIAPGQQYSLHLSHPL